MGVSEKQHRKGDEKLVDYKMLNALIDEKGIKRSHLADLLGINRVTFWQKCNGIEVNGTPREFTRSELEALKSALSLTVPMFRRIFFATERECEATKEAANA